MTENWVQLANASEVEEGAVVARPWPGGREGQEIALYRIEGRLYATSNICTHAYARLSGGDLEDYEVECPIHGGRFDVRTGQPVRAPVSHPLQCFAVREEAAAIFVKLP